MEKVFKTISNSLLIMFLFGLMLIPVASMAVMGVGPQNQNRDVLSAQDKAVTQELEETLESTSPGEPILPDLPSSANPEQINN